MANPRCRRDRDSPEALAPVGSVTSGLLFTDPDFRWANKLSLRFACDAELPELARKVLDAKT
jgi:hypothetical protein